MLFLTACVCMCLSIFDYACRYTQVYQCIYLCLRMKERGSLQLSFLKQDHLGWWYRAFHWDLRLTIRVGSLARETLGSPSLLLHCWSFVFWVLRLNCPNAPVTSTLLPAFAESSIKFCMPFPVPLFFIPNSHLLHFCLITQKYWMFTWSTDFQINLVYKDLITQWVRINLSLIFRLIKAPAAFRMVMYPNGAVPDAITTVKQRLSCSFRLIIC